jgi:hypothetical protein
VELAELVLELVLDLGELFLGLNILELACASSTLFPL